MLPSAGVEELVFCFAEAKAEAAPSVSAKTSAVASPSFFMIVFRFSFKDSVSWLHISFCEGRSRIEMPIRAAAFSPSDQ